MTRWTRLLKRIRMRNADPGTRLHVCRECCEEFVYPVTWTESGADGWWLLLRCGGCGRWQEVVASNTAVAEFDRVLDDSMALMRAAADRLARESLTIQADAFGRALQLDLLGADDFRLER